MGVGVVGLARVFVVDLPADHVRVMAEALRELLVHFADEALVAIAVPVVMVAGGAGVLLAVGFSDEDVGVSRSHPYRWGGARRTENDVDAVFAGEIDGALKPIQVRICLRPVRAWSRRTRQRAPRAYAPSA